MCVSILLSEINQYYTLPFVPVQSSICMFPPTEQLPSCHNPPPTYPILAYPTLPYPTLPYPTLLYPSLQYPTLLYPSLLYPTSSPPPSLPPLSSPLNHPEQRGPREGMG